jgi:hypothetical protein
MRDFVRGKLLPNSQPFEQLVIERRVLITPRSTISISHIVGIAVGRLALPRRYAWNGVLVLLLAALGAAGLALVQKSIVFVAGGGAALLLALVLARYFAKTDVTCLTVSCSDGQVAHFIGHRHTLEEARRLLTDKINADDNTTAFRINFEKGAIQAMGPALHAEPDAPPAHVPVNPTRCGIGSARPGAPDAFAAQPPPVPHHGNGHYPSSATHHVDYAQLLPQIVDMQRFYAQRPDTQQIADQLGELERLMRSGTPTAGGRHRVGQLTNELSAAPGAYPQVLQVFQQVAQKAGS